MDNKILENGILVYNKHYGQGLIWGYKPNMEIYDIIFEGYVILVSLGRKTFFVKGDYVTPYADSKERYSFEGYAPFLRKSFAVKNPIGLIHYLDNIHHPKEGPTIEITVKVNGREVPLNTLSMDTLEKIRATENNHK